jgi:hypothetical protein
VSLSIWDDRHDDMPDLSASSALGEDIGSHAHVIFSIGLLGCSGCYLTSAVSLGVIQAQLMHTDQARSARDEVEFGDQPICMNCTTATRTSTTTATTAKTTLTATTRPNELARARYLRRSTLWIKMESSRAPRNAISLNSLVRVACL